MSCKSWYLNNIFSLFFPHSLSLRMFSSSLPLFEIKMHNTHPSGVAHQARPRKKSRSLVQAATQAKEKIRHIPVFARTLFAAQHAHQQATPVRDGGKKWKIDFEGRRRKIKFNCWQNGKKYFASEFMVEVERFIKNIIQYCANNLVWVIWRGFFNSPVCMRIYTTGLEMERGSENIFNFAIHSIFISLFATLRYYWCCFEFPTPEFARFRPCQDRHQRLNDFRLIINLFPWRFKLHQLSWVCVIQNYCFVLFPLNSDLS